MKKLETFDSSLFIGQSYYNNDRAQLYLMFQPNYETTLTFCSLPDTISERESKGLSNETFMPTFTANKSFSPKLVWMNNFRIKLDFKRNCLKQDKASFTPNNLVNLYIAYELNTWSQDLNAEFSLKKLFVWSLKAN